MVETKHFSCILMEIGPTACDGPTNSLASIGIYAAPPPSSLGALTSQLLFAARRDSTLAVFQSSLIMGVIRFCNSQSMVFSNSCFWVADRSPHSLR